MITYIFTFISKRVTIYTMVNDNEQKVVLGQVENMIFCDLDLVNVPARVDTGARTSTIWASDIYEADGKLRFKLFDKTSQFYSGDDLVYDVFEMREVTPSNGISENRYMIRMLIKIGGRKIRARFTLANRSTQKYPVLIGRNILRGKFVVDVKHSKVKS